VVKEGEIRKDQWLCVILGIISATVAFLTIVPVIVSIFALAGAILSVITVKYVGFVVVILSSIVVAVNLKPEYLLFSRWHAWQFIFVGVDVVYVLVLHRVVPYLIEITISSLLRVII